MTTLLQHNVGGAKPRFGRMQANDAASRMLVEANDGGVVTECEAGDTIPIPGQAAVEANEGGVATATESGVGGVSTPVDANDN